ncbi:MAG: STAS/SEC14 domain-containing protein, partial [Flavobacteriales bacterium]|nr:STAS/SEC14 domain-containing protein [Flavobacteriales bacterium]
KILKALVPLDDFFFERLRKGFEERYFDVSQIDKALEFVSQKKN